MGRYVQSGACGVSALGLFALAVAGQSGTLAAAGVVMLIVAAVYAHFGRNGI